MGVGIVVLLGYFFGTRPDGSMNMLGALRNFFLQGAMIWAAVALIVGMTNLIAVHLRRIRQNRHSGYSFVLLLSLLITLCVGIYDILQTHLTGAFNFQRLGWVFRYVQLPLETSLMAVLTVTLTYAAAQLLSRRLSLFSIVFIGVVLFLLIASIPLVAVYAPYLTDLRAWVLNVVTVAGTRGLLLGIGLGTIATGLRILIAVDRPYGGGQS